jgi:hypothetical protein
MEAEDYKSELRLLYEMAKENRDVKTAKELLRMIWVAPRYKSQSVGVVMRQAMEGGK